MPDSGIEARATAAAATDGSAGKHRCQGASREVHQHHVGNRHRDFGVRFHGGQVHRPAPAQPPPPGAHLRGSVRSSAAVEELGTFTVRFGTITPPALRSTKRDQQTSANPASRSPVGVSSWRRRKQGGVYM